MKLKTLEKDMTQVARSLRYQRHAFGGKWNRVRGVEHLRGIHERRQDPREHRLDQ